MLEFCDNFAIYSSLFQAHTTPQNLLNVYNFYSTDNSDCDVLICCYQTGTRNSKNMSKYNFYM